MISYQKLQVQSNSSVAKYVYIFFLIIYSLCVPKFYKTYVYFLVIAFKEGSLIFLFGMLAVLIPRVLSLLDFYIILIGGQAVYKYKHLSLSIQLVSSVLEGLITLLAIIYSLIEGGMAYIIANQFLWESVLFLICNFFSYSVIDDEPDPSYSSTLVHQQISGYIPVVQADNYPNYPQAVRSQFFMQEATKNVEITPMIPCYYHPA